MKGFTRQEVIIELTDAAIRGALHQVAAKARRTLEAEGLPPTAQLLSLERWLASTVNSESPDSKEERKGGN